MEILIVGKPGSSQLVRLVCEEAANKLQCGMPTMHEVETIAGAMEALTNGQYDMVVTGLVLTNTFEALAKLGNPVVRPDGLHLVALVKAHNKATRTVLMTTARVAPGNDAVDLVDIYLDAGLLDGYRTRGLVLADCVAFMAGQMEAVAAAKHDATEAKA